MPQISKYLYTCNGIVNDDGIASLCFILFKFGVTVFRFSLQTGFGACRFYQCWQPFHSACRMNAATVLTGEPFKPAADRRVTRVAMGASSSLSWVPWEWSLSSETNSGTACLCTQKANQNMWLSIISSMYVIKSKNKNKCDIMSVNKCRKEKTLTAKIQRPLQLPSDSF